MAEFEEYRPLLLGLAYRLLGSMWDAEDIVQEAYLRWLGTDRTAVREVRPFLVTVVSRLALDQLKSARRAREVYPGPWLPEPVPAGTLGPLDTVELRDTVSYATVHLLERLSPPERAVFVLREAFQLSYAEIARTVGVTEAHGRQLHRRARQRMNAGRDRFPGDREEHARLVASFLDAARSGNLEPLAGLLSDSVTAWNDGGGKVRAARRPVVGKEKVLAFVTALLRTYGLGPDPRIVEANGEPALWTGMDGRRQLVAFDVRDGRIEAIYGMLNPDKLTHFDAA